MADADTASCAGAISQRRVGDCAPIRLLITKSYQLQLLL
jgi:hypothetical protein